MLAHAYILSACTRVRSYLYQRAIVCVGPVWKPRGVYRINETTMISLPRRIQECGEAEQSLPIDEESLLQTRIPCL